MDDKPSSARGLVSCSCGYEREWISSWASTATAKLHVVHLGDKAVKHVVTVKKAPPDSRPGEQLRVP